MSVRLSVRHTPLAQWGHNVQVRVAVSVVASFLEPPALSDLAGCGRRHDGRQYGAEDFRGKRGEGVAVRDSKICDV